MEEKLSGRSIQYNGLARRYSLSIGGVAAEPRGGPAISFLWNDGGAGRAMGSASPRPARNGVGMVARRYSLSIGGVAAEPRGGPAISFFME